VLLDPPSERFAAVMEQAGNSRAGHTIERSQQETLTGTPPLTFHASSTFSPFDAAHSCAARNLSNAGMHCEHDWSFV
jgi:hypothetical protein